MFNPDEHQKAVINLYGTNALVLAAPGCGKTEILSQRIIKAHREFGVSYEEMICLTFTNRASREMKNRIKDTLGNEASGLFVGNLHRFCVRFLFDNDLVPLDAAIIDEEDQKDIINEIAGYELKANEINTITALASQIVHKEYNSPDSVIPQRYLKRVLGGERIAKYYIEYKRENHLYDFDDIIIETYNHLCKDDLTDYQYVNYKWLQIDEVQDLNMIQLAIVEKVMSNNATKIFLGDEQQAIYSFIGADGGPMGRIKSLCGDNIFHLYSNYRSPKYLVDTLNQYAINQLNIDSSILPTAYSKNDIGGESLSCICCDDEYELPKIIAHTARMMSIDFPNESIGVLVRSNDKGRNVSEILNKHHIEHLLISNKDIFKRVDFKTLFSHFAVVSDDTRHSEWARLLYQIKAFSKLSEARNFTKRLREIALTPADFMRTDNGSYASDVSTLFLEKEFVIFDTETTGLDVYNDDIIQIAAIKVKNGKIVPNTEFNRIIRTDRTIPSVLANNKPNIMLNVYQNSIKYDHNVALSEFMEYIGDLPLVGHNINYDIRILEQNLQRYVNNDCSLATFECYDTLKIAKLLDPNLRSHKLEFLLKYFNLEGVNSHNAIDDVKATYSLLQYMSSRLIAIGFSQYDILNNPESQRVKNKMIANYKDLFEHTTMLMKSSFYVPYTLVDEMQFISEKLIERKYITPIERFDYILKLVDNVLIDKEKDKYFNQQVNNHLYELRTFNEADLFENGIVKEHIHIMTIHKAKGLQFDNVIVCDVSEGTFPLYWSKNQEEDARTLYVALSRAKKRLYITYITAPSIFMKSIHKRFDLMERNAMKELLRIEESYKKAGDVEV